MPSVVSKLVIAKEIEALNTKQSQESKKIVELSTKYQLFSELTNYILVDEVAEAEKSDDLLEMHKVDNMMVKNTNYSLNHGSSNEGAVFDALPDSYSETPILLRKMSNKISHIWDNIDTSEYEKYLKLLNDWFVLHHRLPRKQSELTLAGFDFEFAGQFDKNQFRKKVKAFTAKLYLACYNHSDLDLKFIKYIEKRLLAKVGLLDKISNYLRQLW